MRHTAFFGDGEYTFALTPALVIELEQKCGAIGLLAQRVFNKAFSHADITETIRLGLIGGGTPAKRATELIAAYVVDRPYAESLPIAAKILERRMFGAPHEKTA